MATPIDWRKVVGVTNTTSWQLVKDSADTIWLTRKGVSVPYGIQSIPVPAGAGGFPDGTALSNALAAIGATAVQQTSIIQSVDSGAIMQGSNKVGAPAAQTPGQTLPKFGQKSSGSEAVGAGPLSGVSDAIANGVDFMKWVAWIFHPLNLLRAVEFVTGIATMFYGINTLMGVMRRGSATHRSTIRSIFNWTPMGKARQISRARRRGRRAGEVQAERDVAYRGARQERARQAGAHQRRLSESTGGTGGTGGTGDERGT